MAQPRKPAAVDVQTVRDGRVRARARGRRRELEYEQMFLQMGVAASQAHASKEADLRFMKAEQAKFFINLDSSDSN